MTCCIIIFGLATSITAEPIIADHTCTNIHQIPSDSIKQAKNDLHIAYGHTSHGSQLITGMDGLVGFMNGLGYEENLYAWNDGPSAGCLDIDDDFMPGDLGSPDRTTWATRTRTYLDDPQNADVNVVIWSWCGQVDGTEEEINTYLTLMNRLELDYPQVSFVYMTGHLDGTGVGGNLYACNNQIRQYCAANGKILFDFADIESYDPDGNYYPDESDACSWCANWCLTHPCASCG